MNIKTFFFPCLEKLKEADKRTDAAIVDLRDAVKDDLNKCDNFRVVNMPQLQYHIVNKL